MILYYVVIFSLTFSCSRGQDVSFYEWAGLIDRNLIKDYFKYIVQFRNISHKTDPSCSKRILLNPKYADCYIDGLQRWRHDNPEKLSCCFLLDYEDCMLDLIEKECGRQARRKFQQTDNYRASKRHMMEILNCVDNYDDIDDCRLPLWAIILIIIAGTMIFAFILLILVLRCVRQSKGNQTKPPNLKINKAILTNRRYSGQRKSLI